MQGLMFNDDCSNFFHSVPADKVSAEAIDERVDDILRDGVSCFCATRTPCGRITKARYGSPFGLVTILTDPTTRER